MRARYQSKPGVAAVGIMLSLGLIFGAQEVMQAAQVVDGDESASIQVDVATPMGAASLDLGLDSEAAAAGASVHLDRSC